MQAQVIMGNHAVRLERDRLWQGMGVRPCDGLWQGTGVSSFAAAAGWTDVQPLVWCQVTRMTIELT